MKYIIIIIIIDSESVDCFNIPIGIPMRPPGIELVKLKMLTPILATI